MLLKAVFYMFKIRRQRSGEPLIPFCMALPLLGREEPTTARVLQDALGTLLLPLRELEPQ